MQKKEYDRLVVEKAAGEIDALIDQIGNVSLNSKDAIVNAEKALSAADENVKAAVKGADKLTAARTKYDELVKAKEIEDAAAKIDSKIGAIGPVSIDSGSAINEARKAYDSANKDVKDAVKKLLTLENAEKQFKGIINDLGASALKNFWTEKDAVTGITWYYPNALPNYIDTRSYVLPYLGVQNGSPWIVVRWNYTGDDWIFYKKVTIVTDKGKHYDTFSYWDIVHDNDGGDVWEYYDDYTHTEHYLDLLTEMGNSSSVIVRFEGDDHYYDLKVSDKDRAAMLDAVYAYYYLENN